MSALNIREKSSWLLRSFLCVFLFSITLQLFSQERKSLEQKKQRLENDIKVIDQDLRQTKNKQKLSLNEILKLDIKINIRKELIYTINRQIRAINTEIQQNNDSIRILEEELKLLKEEYAKMIYYAYKNRDAYTKMMYIFAAEDFDQAYMRLKYLQQYSEFRQRQAKQIENKKQEISDKVRHLEVLKAEKTSLISSESQEKLNLDQEKKKKESSFSTLQDKEKKLKQQLKAKQSAMSQLNLKIRELIEAELAAQNKKNSTSLVLNEEAKKLSASFVSNQGKLPWPLIQSRVTGKFGVHPHPYLPNVKISNTGIDLYTTRDALVRAVFDGEVTGVASLPGSGKLVIIRHGEYLSVYSNMKEVYVSKGDKITTKQNIGTVIFSEKEDKAELHLEIWKGKTQLDPEHWLYKK